MPSKLQTVLNWHHFLEDSYSILQHNLDVWHNGNVKPYKSILPVGNCFEEMRNTHNINYFVPTSGLTFRKEVLDKIFPIPNSLTIAADAYLMRTSFVYGLVYSIPQSLGYYRKHTNRVFENTQFNVQEFFDIILFPSLNNFYSDNNIDYSLKVNKKLGKRSIYLEQLKTLFKQKMNL